MKLINNRIYNGHYSNFKSPQKIYFHENFLIIIFFKFVIIKCTLGVIYMIKLYSSLKFTKPATTLFEYILILRLTFDTKSEASSQIVKGLYTFKIRTNIKHYIKICIIMFPKLTVKWLVF